MKASWVPEPHGLDNSALGERAARGASWQVIESWGGQALQFIVFVGIVRLLAPQDFGVVALSLVFTALARLIAEQGIADALIQRRLVLRSHLDTAFWTSVTLGGILFAAVVLLAVPLGTLLREPAVTPILQVLAARPLISALGTVQVALLRRELAFRSLALRTIAGYLIGGIVGLWAASAGYGPWALVLQQLAFAVVSVSVMWALSPWRPGRQVDVEAFRDLFKFGTPIFGSNLATYANRHFDKLVIGSALGPALLGLYAVAFRLMDGLHLIVADVARAVSLPALARLQESPAYMTATFLRLLRVVTAVALPAYIALALCSREFLLVVMGEHWEESAPILSLLSLSGPLLTFSVLAGAYLTAAGYPGTAFRYSVLGTALSITAVMLAIASHGTLVSVALSLLVANALAIPVLVRWIAHRLAVQPVDLWRYLRGVSAAAVVMALCVTLADFALVWLGVAWITLAGKLLVAFVSYYLGLQMVATDAMRDLRTAIKLAVPATTIGAAKLNMLRRRDEPLGHNSDMGADSRKSVVFVITSLGIGGAETQLYHLSRRLVERGWAVTVIALLNLPGYSEDLAEVGVNVRTLNLARGQIPGPRALLALVRAVRQVRPTVLHSHMVHANVLSRLARPLIRVPTLISTIHHTEEDDDGRRRYHRYAYPLTDRFCELTTQVSKAGIARSAQLGLVPSGRIMLMANGVDTQLFRPDDATRARMRHDLGVGSAFVWLAVGRLNTIKDYPTLLRAMALLEFRHSPRLLLIAGIGPEEGTLRELVMELGIEAHVRFLGLRRDVRDLLCASDAYAMSSRAEGLPMVLLEAAAVGLPIVATNVGGNPDVIRHDESGYLVRPADPLALADAMERVELMADTRRRQLGMYGRQLMIDKFDIELIVSQWEALYERTVHVSTAQ